MIPDLIDRILGDAPGLLGASYNAYKAYRWGDPYIRLVSTLADRNRLSIDVGAHLGDYTFFMRRHSSGCVAFECNPHLVKGLRRRFGKSVDIHAEAVSDRSGETQLRVPHASSGVQLGRATIEQDNALSDFKKADIITVPTTTLDEKVLKSVGLIKVDVEGHELAVLRGATGILARDKPNLILELEERHVPGCVSAAFTFLHGFGYRAFILDKGVLVSVQDEMIHSKGLWNYVFKVVS